MSNYQVECYPAPEGTLAFDIVKLTDDESRRLPQLTCTQADFVVASLAAPVELNGDGVILGIIPFVSNGVPMVLDIRGAPGVTLAHGETNCRILSVHTGLRGAHECVRCMWAPRTTPQPADGRATLTIDWSAASEELMGAGVLTAGLCPAHCRHHNGPPQVLPARRGVSHVTQRWVVTRKQDV